MQQEFFPCCASQVILDLVIQDIGEVGPADLE